MSRNDENLPPTKTADSTVTENNPTSEEQGNKHSHVPSDIALRVKALESVLTEKNLIDPSALDEVVDRYKNKVGPQNGAKVVAKAWVDADYKRRLLKDGSSAIAELGLLGQQGEHMVVVENTQDIHNLVVCTLCSCYPWPTLGLPPAWPTRPVETFRILPGVRLCLRGSSTPVRFLLGRRLEYLHSAGTRVADSRN